MTVELSISSTQALREVLDLVEGHCRVEPRKVVVERMSLPGVFVTVVMGSAGDLRSFCEADACARVQRREQPGAVDYTAAYERPGRRMAVTASVYRGDPEWDEERRRQQL